MNYRKDIDGLRAFSVLPVIFFHAGFTTFSGGYLGVDIFFVISGYLISGIIIHELSNEKFRIFNFYERRIRRILPALLTVLFFTFSVSYFVLLPGEMHDLSQSLFSVIAFASNILFWIKSDYFAIESELNPLLHTWSLAVEEQFYIFFPLMMIAIWGLRLKTQILVLVAILILSLLSTTKLVPMDLSGKFYLLPFRAWELLIGVLAAYISIYYLPDSFRKSKAANWLSFFGLVIIALSILFFDRNTPTPSLLTAIPCLGAFLVLLFSEESSISGKILGNKLLVFIGLLSYSAYLWHQPIFALTRIVSLNEPSTLLLFCLILITFILAYLTYIFIETPFRNRKKVQYKAVILIVLPISIILGFTGLTGHFSKGFPDRFNPEDLKDYIVYAESISDCSNKDLPENWCISPENAKIAILGDSHADAISQSLIGELGSSNIFLDKLVFPCLPILFTSRADKGNLINCENQNKLAYEYLKSNEDLEVIILHARWPLYIESTRFNNLEGGVEYGNDVFLTSTLGKDKSKKLAQKDLYDIFQKSIENYLELGKLVVLIYSVPEVGWHVPTVATRSRLMAKENFEISTSYERFQLRNKNVYKILDSLGDHQNLVRIYPESVLCNTYQQGRCTAYYEDKIFYGDDDHLSLLGADLISKLILKEIILNERNK